ncbi:hypothetical protein [Streptomyces sp. NPDC007369]|uniref:hypothetical protein n=1 Tax=Streptomyces sp. NPDC007369 TaxID=3154589 RepID=UPI0033DD5E1E
MSRGFVVALLFAGCLVVTSEGAAHAGTVEAMNRCTANQVPDIDTTITVRGNGGGSFPAEAVPSNVIEPGDVFYIITTETTKVSTGSGAAGDVGPGGNGVAAPTSFPYPGLSKYSAVLRFNNNPAGWVGSPVQVTTQRSRCIRWDSSWPVRMLFGVNDDNPGDNGGGWDFRILVQKANAVTSPAMEGCRLARTPTTGGFVRVSGSGGGGFPSGSDPGNVLNPGDVFSVGYLSGNVGTGFGSPGVGAYGNGIPAPGGWPYPGLFQYSAVLRFNNNPGGWVGAPAHAAAFGGCHVWSGALPVRLLFGVNDTNTWDNSGYWEFAIRIYR